jgi:light-independent protochlorophyllide reductase subunit N
MSLPGPAGCAATPPVLRERGQREVFCGLTGIVWLHRKIQDAFFLVVGSRTCAHLLQSAAGVMIFAEPRFATAIIDERDLAGLADANAELDRVVTRLLERRPDIKLLFLVGSCPSEVIKLDLSRAAAAPVAALQLPRVRILNYSGSGIETTFTQGEDACLASLVPQLPARRRAPRCWWPARWPTWSRTSSAPVRRLGIGPVDFLPPRRAHLMPPVGPNTRCCWPSPSWPTPCARWKSAAPAAAGAVPARRRRHHRVAAGRLAGLVARWQRRDAVCQRGRPRANVPPARWRVTAPRCRASACSSSPDSQLEVPLARFLSRELGMQLAEVGTPYLHRTLARPGAGAAASRHQLSRRPGRGAPARPLPRRAPDLVVCGLGLANPLEAEGTPPSGRSSWFSRLMQGFEQPPPGRPVHAELAHAPLT